MAALHAVRTDQELECPRIDAGLRARARVRGTITFTLSRRAARHLERDGNLELLQFSDTSLPKASLTVGVFRTYR